VAQTVAKAQSFPANREVRLKARSSVVLRASSAEVDWDRVLLTVLITDIVNSTKLVAEMGDRHWRAVLDRHDDVTRYQIRRFDGIGVNNRGDGFLAMFDSPARAVRCAAAIAQTIAPLGISVHSGIHAGEIHLKRDQISGIAVHVAARIAAIAQPGETFVSKTVRDLVTGSGLVFEDRGIHLLRGVPEEIQLYVCMPLAAHHTSTSF
jgi:class 3 adenylate cyclase